MPSHSNLVDRIQQSLSQQTKRQVKSRMAPSLAYGRHRGPAQHHSRVAAVAVAIFQDSDGRWLIPLTLRPDSLQHHGGQICLPGGMIETGESITDAALREFEEELGVRPNVLTECGEMSTQYVYGSNNLVHPIVIVIESPGDWVPDPKEVAEVIAMPVSVASDQDNYAVITKQKSVGAESDAECQLTFRAPVISFGWHRIWGATALILDELAQMLHPLD